LLLDTASASALDWNSRVLITDEGHNVVAWNDLALLDTSNTLTIDWGSRNLVAPDGVTTILNWNTQYTTSVGSSTFVANSGTGINSASTFDGYTVAKVVKALRNYGLLQ
jgi:hypothetical protein